MIQRDEQREEFDGFRRLLHDYAHDTKSANPIAVAAVEAHMQEMHGYDKHAISDAFVQMIARLIERVADGEGY